jgi:hypothetical protein
VGLEWDWEIKKNGLLGLGKFLLSTVDIFSEYGINIGSVLVVDLLI